MNESDHIQLASPIHILHIFGRMNRGGAELRTLDILRHLSPSEVHMDFCTLSGLPGDLDAEIALMGGNVHPCKLGIGFGRRFRRLIRELKPDVVHSHVHYSSGYLLHLANKEQVPIRIAHFRSTGDGNRRTMRRRVQSRILRHMIDENATHIVAVNEGSLETSWLNYRSRDERCQVIYNGLDISAFRHPDKTDAVRAELGIPDSVSLVIHVGRFTSEKNHRKVMSVFSEIHKKDENTHLLLVGAGKPELESEIRRRCDESGLEAYVTFAGVRTDVPRLLSASDLLLFPSFREGLPGVVLEAKAAGIPVVGSNISGVLEIQAHLPEIYTLDPQSSDRVWSEAVFEALRQRKLSRTGTGVQSIETSVFSLERTIRLHTAMWTGN